MYKKTLLGLILASVVGFPAIAQESGWDNRKIPVVSVADEKKANSKVETLPGVGESKVVYKDLKVEIPEYQATQIQPKPAKVEKKPANLVTSSVELNLEPGQSKDLVVAKNMLNVISTNFHEVVVLTGNSGDIVKEGGDIYVVLEGEAPVGLVIMEKGVPESQIILTLIPDRALPSHIELNVAVTPEMVKKGEDFRVGESAKKAGQVAAGHMGESEYDKYLNSLMVSLAKGFVPSGFVYKETPVEERAKAGHCGLHIFSEHLQKVEGKDYVIDVYRVVNDLEIPYEVIKQDCYREDVRAVGLFPRSYLKTGEETELYIVRSKEGLGKKRSVRPSSIGGR